MTKHTQDEPIKPRAALRMMNGNQTRAEVTKRLDEYDASAIVGLRTIVCDSAIERIDEHGKRTVELPKLRELTASVAVSRCLMPARLRGTEMKAIRKIMRLTLADLSKMLDDRTSPETVSLWETEAQPMGSYAEKILRLLVCEELTKEAPGISYLASKIAHLTIVNPWLGDVLYAVPPVMLNYTPMRIGHTIIDAWNEKKAA